MRHLWLSVAAFAALVGCDNQEPAKSGHIDASTSTVAATSETKPPAQAAVAQHPWGSFKRGSYTKMKSVSEVEIAGNKTKTEITMTYTLKDLTADEAIVEMETALANLPPQKQEMKFPLKAPERKGAADAPKPKTGSEEIEVAGKKLKCAWTETEVEEGGAKTVSKVYTSEEVPGFTVKTVSKNPTMTSTMEAIDWSAK